MSKVRDLKLFIGNSGTKRARLCQRFDGHFCVLIENLEEGYEGLLPHWMNEYPPSGLFANTGDAEHWLNAVLDKPIDVQMLSPQDFESSVGPFPDPQIIHEIQ